MCERACRSLSTGIASIIQSKLGSVRLGGHLVKAAASQCHAAHYLNDRRISAIVRKYYLEYSDMATIELRGKRA